MSVIETFLHDALHIRIFDAHIVSIRVRIGKRF